MSPYMCTALQSLLLIYLISMVAYRLNLYTIIKCPNLQLINNPLRSRRVKNRFLPRGTCAHQLELTLVQVLRISCELDESMISVKCWTSSWQSTCIWSCCCTTGAGPAEDHDCSSPCVAIPALHVLWPATTYVTSWLLSNVSLISSIKQFIPQQLNHASVLPTIAVCSECRYDSTDLSHSQIMSDSLYVYFVVLNCSPGLS